jgi:hypothetical protein
MPISDALKGDCFSQESNLPLVLLTIAHDDLANPIRVVNNKEDITSNGEIYTAFPFEITPPGSQDGAPPTAKIIISNVSREIGQAIRSISTPPSVTITIVRQETPDVVEAQFVGMRLTNVSYDALAVSADLYFEDLTREPYPYLIFSPSIFGGIL